MVPSTAPRWVRTIIGVGSDEGRLDGIADTVGEDDGFAVGTFEIEGTSVGEDVGMEDDVGLALGVLVGALDVEGTSVGVRDGERVGSAVVGESVG